MNAVRRLFKVFLLQILFLYCITPTAFGAKTIKIGVIGAMQYSNGQELWNGALMAADEINKRGGVKVGQRRMRIELVQADSNEFLNVAYATNTMELLLFRNNVDFVVGGSRSEAVLAMQDVAMDYKKIFISIGAALPDLCQRVAQNYDRYKYYFRGGAYNNRHLSEGCLLQLAYVADALRKALGMKTVKVAIAAEKTGWVEGMIDAARKNFPKMGLELTDVFRVSSVATDVKAEIKAIAKTQSPIVFTLFSSNVGTSFVVQAAELELPAAIVGINVDVEKTDFWERTEGKAEYVMTTAAFCKGVEITPLTKAFVNNYLARFGEMPTYTASSYTAIMQTLVPPVEQAGTLDADTIVNIIENRKYETPLGFLAYEKDALGRPTHDLKFGADYAIMLGAQWQNGKLKGVWPNKYVERQGAPPLTYKGIVDYQIPPKVIEKFRP